jgi:glycosyltransferase involved in cell wall biosynthesis
MAWDSYARHPELVRITKTEWNRSIVEEKLGVHCNVVGPSVDIDLNRPRRRSGPDWPHRPLRIAVMIRPSTPRRAAKFTLEVLRELYRIKGGTIEIILFGSRTDEVCSLGVSNDFVWRNAGVLTRERMAFLLNEVEIFADFSSFQAMGLTAMEAMACGAAVLVPQNGGAKSFVTHEENGIIVDTSSGDACLAALNRLVTDKGLRTRIQRKALGDICQFFPERAAFNTLKALFQAEQSGKEC